MSATTPPKSVCADAVAVDAPPVRIDGEPVVVARDLHGAGARGSSRVGSRPDGRTSSCTSARRARAPAADGRGRSRRSAPSRAAPASRRCRTPSRPGRPGRSTGRRRRSRRARPRPPGSPPGTTVRSIPWSRSSRRMFRFMPKSYAATRNTGPFSAAAGAHERRGVVGLCRADRARQVGPGHAGGAADPLDERRRVEVHRGDRGAHRAVLPQATGELPRVDALDARHAVGRQELAQRSLGAPRARAPGGLPDREPRDLQAPALRILAVDPVVALVRRRHRHDLPGVGGIGEHLLVAGHARC